MTTDFAGQLAAHLAAYGPRPFIEFERRWYSGDVILDYLERVDDALTDAGVAADAPLGIVARNRLPHAAAALGLIARRRPITMIYSYQAPESIAAEIETAGVAAVLADHTDWTPQTSAAAERVGAAAVALSLEPLRIEVLAPAGIYADIPENEPAPGLRILSSGTTGPPKRVHLRTEVLAHLVTSMTLGAGGTYEDPPELVYWPFGSVGICQLLAAPFCDRRMVLLEKFAVTEWVRAVKEFGITRAGVQPALLRMILEAGVPRKDLASLEVLYGGSGPLEPDLREEFESAYGIPLLWAYGATEFAGSVCAWTPADHDRHGAAKPSSVGRPLPGVQIRVVDTDSGIELPTGRRGSLQARVEILGPGWIQTTDLASVDEDGFVYIHGRGDGAINRGGFKILPERVRSVLLTHDSILDAAVVGVAHRTLGQVPFAAVELRRDATAPTTGELKDLVRQHLPSHHVPIDVRVVPQLPRNAAWKVRLDAVAELHDSAAAG